MIFLCCVTLLELVDKKTFGLNTESLQGQESKRFSLFYKVKEGMFKKLLRDWMAIHIATCITINLCWTKYILTKLSQGQVLCHAGKRCKAFYTFPKKSRKKTYISNKLTRLFSLATLSNIPDTCVV